MGGLDGSRVVLFQKEHDVQPGLGPIQGGNGLHELGEDAGLVI